MASSATRRKPVRTQAAERRARTLMRDAEGTAKRLTIRVLEGGKGKSPLAVRQAARTPRKGRRKKAETDDDQGIARAVAPIGLKADVTPQLKEAAPVFGDVLRSIAHAVAVTQTALDDTALESLKTLAGQKVDVPVLVTQTLTPDGTPDTVEIKTASMPLTSIVMPSMQQVDQMTLRMDMRVQSFDATSGIKFNQNIASAGASFGSGGFGFALGMSNTNVNAQFSNMSDFSSGSVMMSMDIVDRTGFQIPTPLEYGIGANLLVRLTKVTQTVVHGTPPNPDVITRRAELTVKRVTGPASTSGSGAVVDLNTGEYQVSVPPGLLPIEGPDTTVTPNVPLGTLAIVYNPATAADPYVERKGSVTFGQLTKEFTFHL
jgi:hypothetical protein